MSKSLLTETVIQKLKAAGYESIDTPFQVASVEFEFTAAFHGPVARGLDLVLVLDTSIGDFGEREAERVQSRLETLGRALDISNSKYAMTAILSGAPLPNSVVERVGNVCRVLSVTESNIDGNISDEQSIAIDDQIRVLLPLALNDEGNDGLINVDPFTMLSEKLATSIDKKLRDTVLKASSRGEGAVSNALSARLNELLEPRD